MPLKQSEFFPLWKIWSDKRLIVGVAASILCLGIGIVLGLIYVHRFKIIADEIATVALVQEKDVTRPSSAFPPVSKLGTAQLGESNVFSGFATDAKDVCRIAPPTYPITLLTKQGSGYVAFKTTLTAENCKLLLSSNRSEIVYALTDDPFYKADSSPAYVVLNNPSDKAVAEVKF
jgi:hypothetical protein